MTRATLVPAVAAVLAALAAAGVGRASAVPAVAGSAPQGPIPLSEALDRYLGGDYAVAQEGLSGRTPVQLIASLPAETARWIRAGAAGDAARRRLAALTFVLETGRAVYFATEHRAALDLLRWASQQFAGERVAADHELAWRHALLAVLQGGFELDRFGEELKRASARFPNEPRWRMMSAWLDEALWRPSPHREPPLDVRLQVPGGVIRSYERILTVPQLEAEARVRLSYLHLSAGRADRALDEASLALDARPEPDIRFLAHLFRGWALLRSSRDADALAAFTAARDVRPSSQSAALWVARSLYVANRRDEAEAILSAALVSGDGILDPWRLYSRGDIRLWPALIQSLREQFK